ncbi:putative cytochrome p450 protein [Phaeoacremonium minimum UCRPA7]|uniref:Putative cytochrome p450 protein n=1 Tax=Phaeoacremonium minimum (strain UCR-PA7) TaxID=1286976 RepID=R8BE53_PHAM7|nr:putative cytochrome p450 protein [Phaeoacremonium minimum UCRPA7]EON97550.1 putative cytochrome p450 protein [Phaeoacremonium minimum UCRPA7]
MAARALRRYPFFLRRLVHWFVPECQRIRRDLREARRILKPIIEQRLERNRQAAARGEHVSKIEDTIGWLHDGYQEQGLAPDLATSQLGLAMAAIHTTTELLTGSLLDLFATPQILGDVRGEMRTVLDAQLWKKTTLYQLKLLDSVLKESQRLHTRDVATMRRIVEDPLELSDGTTLPRGAYTMVSFQNLRDPSIYPDPDVFNPRRFLDLRQQPGQENRWQLVSTSPEHLAFGHGLHACPGRFFASNEVKVALCHLLLKYDWKLADGIDRPKDIVYGSEMGVDGNAKVLFRRREEEVPL